MVIISGFESVKEGLITKSDDTSDRPFFITLQKHGFKENSSGVVFARYGQSWRDVRRFSLSTLRDFGLGKKSLAERVTEEAGFLCSAFKSKDGRPFDPHLMMNNAVSNVICSIIFGDRFEYDDKHFRKVLKLFDDIINSGTDILLQLANVIPVLVHLPGVGQKLFRAQENLFDFLRGIIAEHKESWNPDLKRDFIDAFLEEMEKRPGFHGRFPSRCPWTTLLGSVDAFLPAARGRFPSRCSRTTLLGSADAFLPAVRAALCQEESHTLDQTKTGALSAVFFLILSPSLFPGVRPVLIVFLTLGDLALEGTGRILFKLWSLLARKKKVKGDPQSSFSELNLLVTVSDIFLAGTETTSTTLRHGLLYMMLYPDIQRRAQEEIDQVIGREGKPTMDDRANMPYVNAVIHEIQRYSDITPLSVPHMTSRDTEVDGFFIPKGTTLMFNMTSVLKDESIWARPYQFYPEHFLDDDGQFIKREAFLPFSAGRRVCLGEQLARMELFLFFTTFLQQFTFFIPRDQPRPKEERLQGGISAPKPYQLCAEVR
ncbi:cytochrome P450 2D15-like isoform X2 [Lissotriton helveticus]